MRWSRVTLAAMVSVSIAGCSGGSRTVPLCTQADVNIFVLVAQAVPSATQLPCIAELPSGWSYGSSDISSGLARFWLDSDRAGFHAVEVSLRRSCDTTDAIEERPAADETGTHVFVRPDSLEPAFRAQRFLLFEGGCIDYEFRFAPGAASTLAIEAIEAISQLPRATIVGVVSVDPGLTLCGAGAPPCPG